MDSTTKIDNELDTLSSEFDRSRGRFSLNCRKTCRTVAIIGILLILLSIFWKLSMFAAPAIRPQFVAAQTDPQIRVVQPELNARLKFLYDSANSASPALSSPQPSQATEPKIIAWTPNVIGKIDANGNAVPLQGTYQVPAGWYGNIRLLSDGQEIGSVLVDARNQTAPSAGAFSITPMAQEGEHVVRLRFEAVKACRLTCLPGDAVCQATNINYCVGQFDNQAFLSYTATVAQSQTQKVSACSTKTFTAGPKYAPQIPEDYIMCERGQWNADLGEQVSTWADANGISAGDKTKLHDNVDAFLSGVATKRTVAGEMNDSIYIEGTFTPGIPENHRLCNVQVTVKANCQQ